MYTKNVELTVLKFSIIKVKEEGKPLLKQACQFLPKGWGCKEWNEVEEVKQN